MQLNIRPAKHSDAEDIMRLLRQVNDVHADGRPDLFIHGKTKYNSEELEGIIDNPQTPIFVGETESGEIAGIIAKTKRATFQNETSKTSLFLLPFFLLLFRPLKC